MRGIVALLLVLLMCLGGMGGGVAEAKGALVAQYTAPNGLVISSYSVNWTDTNKLRALYDELLQNEHGTELELLKEIEIYHDYPRGNGVAGQYYFQTVSSLLSKTKMQPSKIELYGGEEHKTVESFAHTLSHEYGHHVTHYYTLQADKITLTDDTKWADTTYAKMRGLSDDKRVSVSDGEHRWQIAEIAAEDYVQLFGSPLAKKATPFSSRVEQALAGQEPKAVTWNGSMYNIQPQENLFLPLASDVPGLYEWFRTQIKGDKGTFAPPAKPKLSLVSFTPQGEVGNQLQFAWEIVGEKPNYHYTLVTYTDQDLLPEPIVTRTAKDKKEAKFGPVVTRKGSYIYTYKEPSAKGIRHFKLYAFGDNGWVSQSPVLTVDLANPTQVQVNDSKVIPVERAAPDVSEVVGTDETMEEFLGPVFAALEEAIEVLGELIASIVSFVNGLFG